MFYSISFYFPVQVVDMRYEKYFIFMSLLTNKTMGIDVKQLNIYNLISISVFY